MASFNSDLPAMLVEEERADTNMWDDPPESQTTDIRFDERKVIVAGSLNRLIESLTSVENYGTWLNPVHWCRRFVRTLTLLFITHCRQQFFAHVHYDVSVVHNAAQAVRKAAAEVPRAGGTGGGEDEGSDPASVPLPPPNAPKHSLGGLRVAR